MNIENAPQGFINPTPPLPAPRHRRRWSYVLIALAVIIFLLALGIGLLIAVPIKTEHPNRAMRFLQQMRSFILSGDRDLKGQADDRINIALFGIGGEGHDGPYLTDTIIIASIQPSAKRIALMSVPRDLFVSIPGYGYHKINEADAYGEIQNPKHGTELAVRTLEQTFQIPIQYYGRFDFKAFQELVDAAGGVDVYVDRDFTDTLFPDDYDAGYRTISFKKGWQTMKGATALDFARSRHGSNGENSDFARSRRQQKLILALKEKILSLSTLFNPGKITDILGTLNRNIDTNIELWETAQFYKMATTLDYDNVTMRVLTDDPNGPLIASTVGDAFALVPRDQSWSELRGITHNIFSDRLAGMPPPPASAAPSASPKVMVQNGTWALGLASDYGAKLKTEGIDVLGVGNAPVRNHKTTLLYAPESSALLPAISAIDKIMKTQHINAAPPVAPDDLSHASTPDILIILGEDNAPAIP